MPSPLEKARQDPESMKARILASARRLFGEYGYSSTTTRMIAGDVGIDISTLYYHWGEKLDLYEALITDLNDEILAKFEEVEQQARGKSLSERLDISIDILADYLFIHPEELVAQEIVRLIKHTAANEIIDVAMGQVQVMATRIRPDSPLANKDLIEVRIYCQVLPVTDDHHIIEIGY